VVYAAVMVQVLQVQVEVGPLGKRVKMVQVSEGLSHHYGGRRCSRNESRNVR